MADLIDLTGKVFTRLTVLSRAGKDKHYNSTWNCVCECGNQIVATGRNLRNGDVKSCGCLNHKIKYPEFDNSAETAVYCRYRKSAVKRKISFDLTPEQCHELFIARCYYCDSEPFQESKNWKSVFVFTGIDRVDSRLGYSIDNCVPCCKYCNTAKMSMSNDEFLLWVSKVYNHSIRGSYHELS